MALPIYPIELPCKLLETDKSTQGASFIRSQFIYAPRQRKTKCGKPVFGFSTNFNQVQYDQFLSFYEDDLFAGSREFRVDWAVHGIISVQKVVRFTAPFSFANRGNGIYTVNAELELLDKGL